LGDIEDVASRSDRKRDQRVVLPGGDAIEATPHAHASRERGAARRERRSDPTDLHICPACTGELVQPTEWEPSGLELWRVALRCPDCEWRGSAVHDQKTMDRFDECLDDGTEELLADLTQLSRAIMEEEVERFVDALHRDLIQPEDF
jgi:hypothetical protein